MTDAIVSKATRYLCIAGSCLLAAAGTALAGPFVAIYPGILAVGAILQPKYNKLGRGLMCSGALLLTVLAGAGAFATVAFALSEKAGISAAGILFCSSAAIVMVCDVAIIKDECRIRRSGKMEKKTVVQMQAPNC
jgi:hypothetical protein